MDAGAAVLEPSNSGHVINVHCTGTLTLSLDLVLVLVLAVNERPLIVDNIIRYKHVELQLRRRWGSSGTGEGLLLDPRGHWIDPPPVAAATERPSILVPWR